MIYDIRHVTTYAYESPVSFARCSLRLEPRSGDGQELVSHKVDIKPAPRERSTRRDFFRHQHGKRCHRDGAQDAANPFPFAREGVACRART